MLCYSLVFPIFATEPTLATGEPQREKLLLLLSGEWVSRALYVASKLDIADTLQTGPKTVEELAKLTGSDPDSLHRLLRILVLQIKSFQENFDLKAPAIKRLKMTPYYNMGPLSIT